MSMRMTAVRWCVAGLVLACGAAVAAPRTAYVAVEKVSGNVGFYDADGKCLKEVSVGGHPHEMAFSPDGRYVYVTDNGVLWMTEGGTGGNTVSIVDMEKQTNVGTIDLGKYRRPHGIDVNPKTGEILITTELPSAVLVADPKTRKVTREYDVKGKAPHLVLLGPDGIHAWVTNTDTGTLGMLNLQTGDVKLTPVGARPQGMALSPDFKRIYVTNSGGESITVVDTATQNKVGEIPTGKGPVRVAVTPDGNTLIYAIQTGEAVGFANARTLKEEKQIPLPGQPVSMTFSPDHKWAYSSVQSQDKIFVISVADRKIDHIITTPKGSGPDPYRYPPTAR